MELIPVLATVIVITTIVTIVFGLLSYMAFRLREDKRPSGALQVQEARFVRRYKPTSV